MKNNEKKDMETPEQNKSGVNLNKTTGDFEYVQLDSSIHDTKFQTKPTTFFKDAMKRFAKNRSSVVAAVILMIIIGMAIIVPLADTNDIDTAVSVSSFLPPKWWGTNDNGFLDGTGVVKDTVIDPTTMTTPSDSFYAGRAIVDGTKGITYHTSYYNILSDSVKKYGRGGSVVFRTDSVKENGGVISPKFTLSTTDDLSVTVTLNQERCSSNMAFNPTYAAGFVCDFKNDGTLTPVLLKDYSQDYAPFTLQNVASLMKNSTEFAAAGSPASFPAYLLLEVKTSTTGSNYPALFVDSVSLSGTSSEADSAIAFTDATAMMASTNAYSIFGSATLDIYQSAVILGDFRYDYYEAAFGNDDYIFDSGLVDEFIKKGYMTYTWSNHNVTGDYDAGEFALTELGKTYCPLQAVSKERITAFRGEITGRSIIGTRSLYRYDYYKGLISKCAYPQYLFGTNGNGQDFFKIVFSGLGTSLLLGLLTAVINFTVGLIWGSISGYFGGWTDILMERFTEILGGMPWIVMFTLIVLLLGSNFNTFLLALCLTGWMGMASGTREQFYRFKGREYVLASRTLGASDARLIFRHILPNGIGTIITSAAFMIPGVIFSEASISYLLPSTLALSANKSFGVTLSQAQSNINQYPYMIVSASIVMVFLMISFNLFGNGMRDAFNPSLKGSDN